MNVTQSEEDYFAIFSIQGDIDLHHSPKLRTLFQSKVQGRCPALVIDFTHVNYIDSSGLATLVEYYQSSRSYKGKMILVGMNARVRSVFDLVRLSEIFSIFVSLEEAKQSFALQP